MTARRSLKPCCATPVHWKHHIQSFTQNTTLNLMEELLNTSVDKGTSKSLVTISKKIATSVEHT